MLDFLADKFLPYLLNMSITAGIVILFVLLARFFLKKSPKIFSYALWAVVLFRLICPVSVTVGFSLLELVNTPYRTTTPYTSMVEYIQPEEAALTVSQSAPREETGITPASSVSSETTAPLSSVEVMPKQVLAGIWLTGVLVMASYGLLTYFRIRRRLIGAIRLRDNIYLVDYLPSPFVMGIFRPRIYLPSSLSRKEQGYILRHEQHHIHRLDHVVKALSFVVLCVHWFNPLVWLAFILSGKDMEMSCDEAVVKAFGENIRADYSASLLSLATGRRIIAGTPLAFGEGNTKGRIRNLVNWKKPKRWVLGLTLVLCLLVVGACVANPQSGIKESGQYVSMEDFAQQTMANAKTVTYYNAAGEETTTEVLATKIAWLEKKGEVEGLAPEGTLEAWTFNYLVQIDVPMEEITLAGGMYAEDGCWYDLEGQGGHNVVALRYGDGSYDILYNEIVNDNLDFYGYHQSYEEAIYDWYVTEMGLDLPLYVKDWIDEVTVPSEVNLGNIPVHRYDGDGWYLYIPIQGWEKTDATGDIWRSAYDTGSNLMVYVQEMDAQNAAEAKLSQGWTMVEDTVPHLQYTDSNMKDYSMEEYYYDNPAGGCYMVRIEWLPENVSETAIQGLEPVLLRAMAESFTVDENMRVVSPSDNTLVMQSLNGVDDDTTLNLSLTFNQEEVAVYETAELEYYQYYLGILLDATWRPLTDEVISVPAEADSVTLSEINGWSLTAYTNLDRVHFMGPTGEEWYTVETDSLSVYQALRRWFDDLEYVQLTNSADLVIPDEGQSYLEAAATFAERYEAVHLEVTEGSQYCFTFVKTLVTPAEEPTAYFRESGEIGENTYCFYLQTIYIPQNEAAAQMSMAGNTTEYTEEDSSVPEDAKVYTYSRCAYLSLEEDGWHGKIAGTGW